jgi:hypothetical protein
LILDDLERLPRHRLRVITHEEFLVAPQAATKALAGSLGLGWDRALPDELPLSKVTVSQPRPDKWRRLEQQIEEVMPIVAATDQRARDFVASFS